MPRADAQKSAARRQLIDAGDRMSSHRRDPGAGNRHASADMDALGVDRSQRQCRVAIGPDHLGIRHPCAVVTKVLGDLDAVPFADMSVRRYCELDSMPPARPRNRAVHDGNVPLHRNLSIFRKGVIGITGWFSPLYSDDSHTKRSWPILTEWPLLALVDRSWKSIFPRHSHL